MTLETVYNCILNHGPLKRGDIAAITGLNKAKISNALTALLKANAIKRTAKINNYGYWVALPKESHSSNLFPCRDNYTINAVIKYLKQHGPSTSKQISLSTGKRIDCVTSTLAKMKSKGQVTSKKLPDCQNLQYSYVGNRKENPINIWLAKPWRLTA